MAGLLDLCVATNAPGATYSIRVIDSSVDSISAAHPVRLEGSARSGQLDGQATGLAPRLAVSGLSAAKTLKACRAANPATARLLVKGGAPLSAGPAPSADVLTLIIGLD